MLFVVTLFVVYIGIVSAMYSINAQIWQPNTASYIERQLTSSLHQSFWISSSFLPLICGSEPMMISGTDFMGQFPVTQPC